MSITMMKIAVAALMAGAAQAKPVNMGPSSINIASFTTLARPTSTGSSMTQGSASSSSSNGSQTTGTGTGFPSFVSSTIDATAAAQLAKQLDADLTQVDVLQELLSVNHDVKNLVPITDPEDVHDQLTFDFKAAPVGGDGGRILVANEKNFPFLVSSKSDGSNGISGAVAFLEPCGMNSPHTHPRATEILTVVEGELEVGFVMENGLFAAAAKDINALAFPFNTTVQQFEATIFPQGSIHFQFNPTCERSIFVAALNSADPGTSQIAQNFFTLDQEIVDITLGVTEGGNKLDPSSVDQFRKNLPANLVRAVDSCRAKCGM
jgi:oxalate decarboxylase/phosphoglucose isomerase-like protein (cupin superfamily)